MAQPIFFDNNFTTFAQCVAVSQSGNPTGGYNSYEFSFDSLGLPDYPKHGIVTDSITMSANIFSPPNFFFTGTFIGVMDKAAMYAGLPASLIGFNLGSNEFGFVAGDLDGSGTSPALFATAMSSRRPRFDIWQIDPDFGAGTATSGRIARIPISGYGADLCSASREACIPQPNGAPALEAISDRLMQGRADGPSPSLTVHDPSGTLAPYASSPPTPHPRPPLARPLDGPGFHHGGSRPPPVGESPGRRPPRPRPGGAARLRHGPRTSPPRSDSAGSRSSGFPGQRR